MSRRGPDRRSREEERIGWLQALSGPLARPAFPVPNGDDAAVWRPGRRRDVVLTVDVQAAGTHFREGWLAPEDIGRRAVTAAVSDIAAMGADPAALLVSILSEESLDESGFRRLARGIDSAAREYGAPVCGGNLSRGALSVTITAVGQIARGRALRRSGLRPGDELWVTGTPGLALLGRKLLEGELELPPRSPLTRDALAAFRRPVARLDAGRRLARRSAVSACIDLSDGLGRDLGHLLEATRAGDGPRVGVEVEERALLELEPVASICARAGRPGAANVLEGGDDYELCFAWRPGRGGPPSRLGGVPLTRIGRVTGRAGLRLLRLDGSTEPIVPTGFEHFGREPAGQGPRTARRKGSKRRRRRR